MVSSIKGIGKAMRDAKLQPGSEGKFKERVC
jgi:hypothetical protein